MPSATTPSVSLVVVNYNAASLCVRLVSAVAGDLDEIVVVDNASADVDVLDQLASTPRVEIVRLTENRGYGAGANVGRAHAHGDVIVVANPDVYLTGEAVRRLAVAAHRVGLAGPRFAFADGTLQRSAHRKDPLYLATLVELCSPVGGLARRVNPDWHPTLHSTAAHGHDLEARHLLGALMAVDAELWDAVGGFDESFFLYREETDLCRRISLRGGRIRFVASVTAEHISGASSSVDTPMTARRAWLESHYRYIRKHRGRVAAAVAEAIGTIASFVALLDPKRRDAARAALVWHVRRSRRRRGPDAAQG